MSFASDGSDGLGAGSFASDGSFGSRSGGSFDSPPPGAPLDALDALGDLSPAAALVFAAMQDSMDSLGATPSPVPRTRGTHAGGGRWKAPLRAVGAPVGRPSPPPPRPARRMDRAPRVSARAPRVSVPAPAAPPPRPVRTPPPAPAPRLGPGHAALPRGGVGGRQPAAKPRRKGRGPVRDGL